MGDFAEQLEDLADCKHYKLLVYAGAVPSAVRQLRRAILEHGAILHHLEMI